VGVTPLGREPASSSAIARVALLAALFLGCSPLACGVESGAVGQSPPESSNARPVEQTFDVLEYEVEGNSVLTNLQIEKAVYPYLGYAKTIKDVESARTALEKVYREHGFLTVFVDIPEQQVDAGVVVLRVTEGRVSKLAVTGNRYYSRGAIRAQVPELSPGQVPNFTEVQQQVAQLNKNANRQVTPVLRAGTAPGTVDIELKVDDKAPWHADLELNNNQSPNTPPLRLQGSVRYDNLWQKEHSVSLFYQTAPQEPQDLSVVSGSYLLPMWDSNVLALYALHSNSQVAAVGGVNVVGTGTIAGARAVFPLPAREGLFQSVTLGIDYKNLDESVLQGTGMIETPITYVPLMAQYRANWQNKTTSTEAQFTLNMAPRGLFGNSDEEFEQKRFNAKASYVYLRAGWKTQLLLGRGFQLLTRLEGQLSNQPLVSSEQFCLGGVYSVRGYLECESLGDNGLFGSIQIARALSLPPSLSDIQGLTLFAFVDAGDTTLIDALPGQTDHFTQASLGLGLHFSAFRHLDGDLDVAFPTENSVDTKAWNPRILFRLAYGF